MKRTLYGVLTLAVLLAVAPASAVRAENGPTEVPTIGTGEPAPGGLMAGEMRHGGRDMSPEQRAAMKAKMKEKFDSLPPEKQAEIKAKMAERREKMKNMTPEEREAMMQKFREGRGGHGGRHRGGNGGITHGMQTPAPTDVPE